MHGHEIVEQYVPTCSIVWSIEPSGLKAKLVAAEAENESLQETLDILSESDTKVQLIASLRELLEKAEVERDVLRQSLDATERTVYAASDLYDKVVAERDRLQEENDQLHVKLLEIMNTA